MKYDELIQLYFERSNALQWYWNIYVIVIGGLVAFSSFRPRRDLFKTALVSVLYCMFAYKNLDAIHDVTVQRFATLDLIKQTKQLGTEAPDVKRIAEVLEPTLILATPEYEGSFGVRNFHIYCDLLTIATLWVMEFHRKKEG
ncbi:MAG: hypothetical protein ACJ8FY_12715 [Gemmataceae bacterium]